MDGLRDRAVFWVAVAGVVAVIGGIPMALAAAQDIPIRVELLADRWFQVGAVLEAVAILALCWAIILQMAHGHAASHVNGQPELQSGKKGAKKVAPYRLAVDTLLTWIYRRKEWHGLSTDGKYREPAPMSVGTEFCKALHIPGSYEPVENIAAEPGFDGPSAAASAGVASGTGTAHGATAAMTGAVEARAIPGPGSPTLPQVSYLTQGRRHFAYDKFGQQPKAIRFSLPESRMLRSSDLPYEIPVGNGQLVVEKFFATGVVIDEDGTNGDEVAFIAYLEGAEDGSGTGQDEPRNRRPTSERLANGRKHAAGSRRS